MVEQGLIIAKLLNSEKIFVIIFKVHEDIVSEYLSGGVQKKLREEQKRDIMPNVLIKAKERGVETESYSDKGGFAD